MTDQTTDCNRLESPLDSAVRAVISEPLPKEATERVKNRAKGLGTSTGSLSRPGFLRRLWIAPVARYGSLAAAVLLFAGIASLLLLTDRTTGRAFAQMIQNIKQAESVQLTMTSQFGRNPEQKIRTYFKGNRVRTELFGGKLIHVADFDEKRGLVLDTRRKTARSEGIDEQLAKEAANPIDQLRRVKPDDAKKIGEEHLNKRLTHVYRIRKAALLGMSGLGQMMVWIDSKTALPVKIEIHNADPKAETKIRFEDFVWNEPLDDSLFALSAPEGYKMETVHAPALPKKTSKPAPAPQSPDPQFADGILSRDRAASRMAWNPTGTTLTALMRDPETVDAHQRQSNELRRWNVATGELLWSVDIRGASSFAASAADGSLATVIGYEIQLRDPNTGQVKQKWTATNDLLPLAFSPDGKTLAAGIAEWGRPQSGEGQAGGVQFWNAENGTLIRSVAGEHPTTFIRYSPNGQTLASASNDGSIRLWNTTTGELVRIFPCGGKIGFSPDSRLIALMASQPLEGDTEIDVRNRYDVQIYEVQTGKLTQTLTSDDHTKKSWVLWIEFSPDGRLVAVANWDGTVKLWDVSSGELKKTITEHRGGVHTCVFSPDGKSLATGGEDRMLHLWNLEQLVGQ